MVQVPVAPVSEFELGNARDSCDGPDAVGLFFVHEIIPLLLLVWGLWYYRPLPIEVSLFRGAGLEPPQRKRRSCERSRHSANRARLRQDQSARELTRFGTISYTCAAQCPSSPLQHDLRLHHSPDRLHPSPRPQGYRSEHRQAAPVFLPALVCELVALTAREVHLPRSSHRHLRLFIC